MTVKWSNPPAGGTCLDVCCGSGDLALMLARQVGPGGRVVGIDFSAEQLAIAQQRSQSTPYPDALTWIEGDAMALPFEADTFDAVTMGYGLRNVTDILLSLQELHRVLKPGATAAILDLHRPGSPQIRNFQNWYLGVVVVPIAQRLGLEQEYAYINPSLERFPTGPEQVTLARQAGFATAIHYPIAGGMMGVLVATKAAT